MPNFNALLMEGFNTARGLRMEDARRNALSDYFGNPDDPQALAGVARYDPKAAFDIRGQQQEQRAAAEKRQRELLDRGKKAVGQAALGIARLPEEQRARAWDQQIDYLVQQGYDGLAPFKGRYSEQSLQGVLADSGLMVEFQAASKPSYMAVPAGGYLQGFQYGQPIAEGGAPAPQSMQPGSPLPQQATADQPNEGGFALASDAVRLIQSMGPQGFLNWQKTHGVAVEVQSPQDAANLPPGTLMRTPDGRTGVKR